MPRWTPLTTVTKAAVRAAHWHSTQRRKGTAQEPYVNHLLEVAAMVAEATGGEDVAALVAEVTDDKALPKPDRKRLQLEHAPDRSPRAALLKLADKTSNLLALTASPPSDWPTQRRLDYVQWARDVVAGLRVDDVSLRQRFADAADAAERAARAA